MVASVGRARSRTFIALLWAAFLVLVGEPLSSEAKDAVPTAVAGAAALALPTPAASLQATAAGTAPATPRADKSTFTVLCYHQFGEQAPDDPKDPKGRKKKRSLYKITREEFEWQMQYLRDHGIIPLTLERVYEFMEKGKAIPARSVLITFDDGYRTIFTEAFPILKKYGYPAVLFLYTDFLASQSASLRYDDIRRMLKGGLEIGSHSKMHINMARESVRRTRKEFRHLAIRELHESAGFLEEKFGKRPRDFAYPYGVYTRAVIEEARRLGYRMAFTINPGPNDRTTPVFKLRRHLITYLTRRDLFADIFETKVLHLDRFQPPDGGIVWIRQPQITAVLTDDIDPKTLRLQIGQRTLPHTYDPKTHTLTKKMLFALRRGGHQATLTARDKTGARRTFSWYFRVEEKKAETEESAESLIPLDPGKEAQEETGKDEREKEKKTKKESPSHKRQETKEEE